VERYLLHSGITLGELSPLLVRGTRIIAPGCQSQTVGAFQEQPTALELGHCRIQAITIAAAPRAESCSQKEIVSQNARAQQRVFSEGTVASVSDVPANGADWGDDSHTAVITLFAVG